MKFGPLAVRADDDAPPQSGHRVTQSMSSWHAEVTYEFHIIDMGSEWRSALPPKADMCGAARDVRFGPIAYIGNFNFRDRDKLMPITSKNS